MSSLEDVIYVFEANNTKDSLKLNVIKKHKNKYEIYKDYTIDESEDFPMNFEGRNIFIQHQFIYFMNKLFYLDIKTSHYKQVELFRELDDRKIMQFSPIYCPTS